MQGQAAVPAIRFTTVSEALVSSVISSLDAKRHLVMICIAIKFIKIHPDSIGRLISY